VRHCRFRLHYTLEKSLTQQSPSPAKSPAEKVTEPPSEQPDESIGTVLPAIVYQRLSPYELLVEQSKLCMLDAIQAFDYQLVHDIGNILLHLKDDKESVMDLLRLTTPIKNADDQSQNSIIDSFEGSNTLTEMCHIWASGYHQYPLLFLML